MECENVFCLYCRDRKCILEEITLDIQGKCNECIYVEIEEEYMEDLKKEQLLRLSKA